MIEMLMENTLQSFSSDVDIYLSSVPIMQLHYCTLEWPQGAKLESRTLWSMLFVFDVAVHIEMLPKWV